jgi:hypothetical protein
MNEKKQCDFFSTRALFSRILNFRKKSHFLLFISEIAQNVSTISSSLYAVRTTDINFRTFEIASVFQTFDLSIG